MTPKAKAESLSYYYWNLLEPYIKDEQERGRLSVKCAIIAVEEAINALPKTISVKGVPYHNSTLEYYNNVLIELKLMQ